MLTFTNRGPNYLEYLIDHSEHSRKQVLALLEKFNIRVTVVYIDVGKRGRLMGLEPLIED